MELSSCSLEEFENEFDSDSKNKLALNAVCSAGMQQVLVDRLVSADDTHVFSNRLQDETKVTSQKSSGRCWIFAALNVIRLQFMKRLKLDQFEFSQSYLFFFDKLEKSNHFLENVISTIEDETGSRVVQYLLNAPVDDGGQYDMLVNLIVKYGLVPKSAFPESSHSGNSRMLNAVLTAKLREYAARLRDAYEKEKLSVSELREKKKTMVSDIYRILCISLGKPPSTFDFKYEDKEKEYHSHTGLTPQKFLREVVNFPIEDMVSVINDPRNEYNKTYTVKYLGNVQGGRNVKYLNLPVQRLKDLVRESLLNNEAVWFGCDVGKFSSSTLGIMDLNVYNYELLFGVKFEMTKSERLLYGHSLMTHAMVFTGIDIVDDTAVKYRVENSWGDNVGEKGYFLMTDDWFSEYVYQLVVPSKYLKDDELKSYEIEPHVLPPWDPMGALAE